MTSLTIATRGSMLALWQAEHIGSRIRERTGLEYRLLVLKTKGDIILDVPLSKVGGKGLFVKEIEEALLDGRADIAVHSMKDVPMKLPEGLTLGAVPRREDPADLLLSARFPDLDSLPRAAKVGTSSLRRQAQLLALRPDLTVLSLRGNVNTRMRKLLDGEFDAIVMATAGMKRLELTAPHMFPLSPPDFLPASGQGALGIELMAEREDLLELLRPLNHGPTQACVSAERAFLAALEGGCQTPIAAYARLDEDSPPCASSGQDFSADSLIRLEGLVADVSGTRVIRKSMSGKASEAERLGRDLALHIKDSGGAAILAELYETGSI
ncbi:hydroxymethylbilane synthase [Desulfovibrio sp. OttesenSCG-928-A18]|nr:hydroxymethylbilane synthase [Desulfovibrio sp. OttesenSCG-928-A18]